VYSVIVNRNNLRCIAISYESEMYSVIVNIIIPDVLLVAIITVDLTCVPVTSLLQVYRQRRGGW